MTNEVDTTPEQEVNDAPETTENTEQETVEAEPTVADLHKEDKPVPESIPKARLDKEIKRRKELEKELAKLRDEKEEDDTVDDVEDVPEVKKLAQELEQIKEEGKRARAEQIFTEHLNKALEQSPEYKDVVNVSVIKALAFDPANANKTYKALLEEAYGNAVTGRRTVENTTPRGGAKDTKLDMARAKTDTEYRREVLADPELRKQYNEGLTDRVFNR